MDSRVGPEAALKHSEARASFSDHFCSCSLPVIYQPHFQVQPSIFLWTRVFQDDDGRVWCTDGVVPFLRPIVLHQAQWDVISLSQAQPPTMLHYLCVCVCVSVCVHFHPANNASLYVSPRAPLTFLPVSLPSESRVICSSHIYRADLCLIRKHIYRHMRAHTHKAVTFVSGTILVTNNYMVSNQYVCVRKTV